METGELLQFQSMENDADQMEVIAVHKDASLPFGIDSIKAEERTVNLEIIDIDGHTTKVIEVTELLLKDADPSMPSNSADKNKPMHPTPEGDSELATTTTEAQTQRQEEELIANKEENTMICQQLPGPEIMEITTNQCANSETAVNSNLASSNVEHINEDQSSTELCDDPILIEAESRQFTCIEDEVSVEILAETCFPAKPPKPNKNRKRKSEASLGTPYKILSGLREPVKRSFLRQNACTDAAKKRPKQLQSSCFPRNKTIRHAPRSLCVSWAKMLFEQDTVACPVPNCERSFRNHKLLKRHYQWCQADQTDVEKCPFCLKYENLEDRDIVKHVKQNHVEKLLEYIRIYSSVERVPEKKRKYLGKKLQIKATRTEDNDVQKLMAVKLAPTVTSVCYYDSNSIGRSSIRNKEANRISSSVQNKGEHSHQLNTNDLHMKDETTRQNMCSSKPTMDNGQNLNSNQSLTKEIVLHKSALSDTVSSVEIHEQGCDSACEEAGMQRTDREGAEDINMPDAEGTSDNPYSNSQTETLEISLSVCGTMSTEQESNNVREKTVSRKDLCEIIEEQTAKNKARIKLPSGRKRSRITSLKKTNVSNVENADKILAITKYAEEITSESDTDETADEEAPENKYIGEIFDSLARTKHAKDKTKKTTDDVSVVRQKLRSTIDDDDLSSQESLSFSKAPIKAKFRGTLINTVQVMNMNVNMPSSVPSIPATVVTLNFLNQKNQSDLEDMLGDDDPPSQAENEIPPEHLDKKLDTKISENTQIVGERLQLAVGDDKGKCKRGRKPGKKATQDRGKDVNKDPDTHVSTATGDAALHFSTRRSLHDTRPSPHNTRTRTKAKQKLQVNEWFPSNTSMAHR